MRTTFAAASLTAALLGGATAGTLLFTPGLAGAQTDDTTSATATDEAARPEPGAWVADALAGLVADGTITQDQADAVAAALEEARPERGPRGIRPEALETAAEVLGTTAEDLRTALQEGQTLADLATAGGVDVQTLIDALVADATAHIEEAVAAGELDADRAAEISANLVDRVTAMVDGELPEGGPRGPHGPRGGDVPAGAASSDSTGS